jgi:phospholipid/cholesterol/gamma-HCH transport system substrate-binding protein
VDRADRLFARLDHVVEDTLGDVQRRQLRNTIANVETVSERAVTVADDISALTTDVRGEIDPVVTDVRRAIEQVRTILADAEEIVRTIRRGEGTVGALLMDEQIFDDLKELIRDLKHNPWKFFWRE